MKNTLLFLLSLIAAASVDAQKIFNVWPGIAPGSESWTWKEGEDTTVWPDDPLAFNVVQPTLTYYPADPAVANGTAAILCPGGSFYYLHVKTEGSDVAKFLNKKGVAAFVLKYRVVHSETIHPVKEKNEKLKDQANFNKLMTALAPLAIADAREAIAYVRRHAAELGIKTNRIGIVGFSAGGALAVTSAFGFNAENRPDFLAPVYAYVPPALSITVSKETPPVFIAAATDDELHLVPMSIRLYNAWLEAGHSAELHIYSKGGHGFGMNKNNQPSDTWIDRFGDWLLVQGLLKK